MIKNNYQKVGTENKGIILHKPFVQAKNSTTGIALHKPFVRIKNSTTGITLIALVITIIVLLILAGVTIAMLTGENGIITKANEAKVETETKSAIEKVQVEIMGSYGTDGKINITELNKNLGKITGITGVPITTFPATITVDGNKIRLIESNGIVQVTENTEYKDGEKVAIIPKGFRVSDKAGEKEINEGLVVIGPDGSEFVWVPVDKTTLCADGTTGKEIAEKPEGSTDYRGVLYDFTGTEIATESSKRAYSASGYREPDVVTGSAGTDYDGNKANLDKMKTDLKEFADANAFKAYMQTEYNQIIGSIQTNGGYYVGRYESSVTTDGNIQVKKGVKPTSAGNTLTSTWYGLYSKQKIYVGTLSGTDNNLKSAMIYGSMYDGMLNFALNGAEKTKITASSTDHVLQATGIATDDKINNIYDLGNNLREWTTEADSTTYRAIRRRRLRFYLFTKPPRQPLSDQCQQLLWE